MWQRHSRRAVTLVVICLALTTTVAAAEETMTFGPFGTVTLYRTTPQPANVVLFVSGDGGWNLGVLDMARAISSLDALVVGIDITAYLKSAAKQSGQCTYDAASFEALSQYVQKKLGFDTYHPPVLIGYSSGATLVYALLVQAPAGTFRGAISMGFCPDLPLAKPPCRGSGLEYDPGPHGKGLSFRPAPNLEVPWVAFQGVVDQVCSPQQTAEFTAKVGSGQLVQLPKVGHGFAVQANWLPQLKASFSKMVTVASKPTPSLQMADVADLPLVEIPATGSSDRLVVMLSGDGGWAGLDREVSAALAAQGVPVVGWNSLQYYWKPRTPEGAAADLDRLIRHYREAWKKERVVLAGYSLGADDLPFLVNRLSDETRSLVEAVVLIGLSHTGVFEMHLSAWLGGDGGKDALPTLPEVRGMKVPKTLCLYGSDEKDSACTELGDAVHLVELGGGHHFGGDYAAIARRILDVLDKDPPAAPAVERPL